MSGWYEVEQKQQRPVRFVLKAANAETILTSEQYTTRAAAEKASPRCRANSPLDERYEKKTTKDGHPYFNLKAANHEIIGSSEAYSSEAALEKGIASVKANGADQGDQGQDLAGALRHYPPVGAACWRWRISRQ